MASEQKRLFLAIALSAVVLFTWQTYFAPKPIPQETLRPKSSDDSVPSTVSKVDKSSQVKPIEAAPIGPVSEKKDIQTFTVVNNDQSVTMTSDLKIIDFKSKLATDALNFVVGNKTPIQFLIFQNNKSLPLNLNLTQEGNKIFGSDEHYNVEFIGLLEDSGQFKWTLKSNTPFQYQLLLQSEKKEGEARQIRQFLGMTKEVIRSNVDDEEFFDGLLQWVGVDYHYHLFVNVLDKKSVSAVVVDDNEMRVKIVEPTQSLTGYTIFSQKNYSELKKIGNNLHLSVDFGIFGVVAVPILNTLQFIHRYVPNFGLAIILITLLVRTLLFPLQIKSFKSMKKMQKLQPELAKLKEKFKDDPQRLQRETMELFKRSGANPMGGCLPLLLQMPVFFAFYQVLLNSVELLGAPFVLWITDLSAKDPYYVLPILMGAALFGQSKLNPSTTADPTQQKMMMFMPLIFTFFMKDLPAGLSLYMLVSTLFGIVSQLVVYKTAE